MTVNSRVLIAVLATLLASAPAASPLPDRLVGTGAPALGGAGAGGVNPTPPIGNAPVDPSMSVAPAGGSILLQVLGPGRRVVVLRSRAGELLALRPVEPGQALGLWVPREGALLDVLGSDVVSLPVAPGCRLAVAPGT